MESSQYSEPPAKKLKLEPIRVKLVRQNGEWFRINDVVEDTMEFQPMEVQQRGACHENLIYPQMVQISKKPAQGPSSTFLQQTIISGCVSLRIQQRIPPFYR